MKIAIIGGGGSGIEAALYAKALGHDLSLFEMHGGAAELLSQANGHQLFSSWETLISPLGLKSLPPVHREYLKDNLHRHPTAGEYVERYLKPLAQCSAMNGVIRYGQRVLAVGKSRLRKNDLIAKPERAQVPFRLLLRSALPKAEESFDTADVVVDASGVYGQPNPVGEGGIFARNEQRFVHRIAHVAKIDYSWLLTKCAGGTILFVGSSLEGLSVAQDLMRVVHERPNTRLVWLSSSRADAPFVEVREDPLPARRGAALEVNAAVKARPEIDYRPASNVIGIDESAEGRLCVDIMGPHEIQSLNVDVMIANTGYHPDRSLYQTLQFHECYASWGPMKLSAAMLGAASNSIAIGTSLGAETLLSPEPNFFVIGRKSYGLNEGFFSGIALAQIVELFSLLENDPKLNLYTAEDAHCRTLTKPVRPKLARHEIPEERLSNQEEKYKTIAENLKEVVFSTDLQHKMVYLSPSWKSLSGYEVEDFIGRSWMDLLYVEDRTTAGSACDAFVALDMDEYHEEFRIQCSDGSIRWVEVNANVLIGLNREAYGTIGTMLDITARKVAEQSLVQAKELAEFAKADAERQAQALREQLAIIEKQSEAIRDLSVPILEIWEDIVAVPIVGNIDQQRGYELTERLLNEVSRRRTHLVVLDLTGVKQISPDALAQLQRVMRAVGLLGARCVLTGTTSETARALIEFGLDLRGIDSLATVREALQRKLTVSRAGRQGRI